MPVTLRSQRVCLSMATIRKKGDKYQVQIRRKGFAPISRSFHQRTDAEQWARHMDVKADRGELPAPIKVLDRHTVKSILERYKREISIEKRSYCTEQHVLNRLMRQSFASLTMAEITAAKLCTYRDNRLKQVKPGTVRRELAILRHAFDVAEREWGIPIRENPLSKLPKIRPQAGRTRRLAPEEYDTIRQAVSRIHRLHIGHIKGDRLVQTMRGHPSIKPAVKLRGNP